MKLATPEDALQVCDPCTRRRHAQCVLLADLRMGAGVSRWCICPECRLIAREIAQERVLRAALEERKQEVLDGAHTLGIKDDPQARNTLYRATRHRRIEVDVFAKLGGLG